MSAVAFHADRNIDFQLARLVGEGASSIEQDVRAAARQIHDFDDWTRELSTLAARAETAGDLALAARYVRAAEFFVAPGLPEKRELYERFRVLFERAWSGRFERSAVRFGHVELPVMRLRPPGAARGVLVVHGGFDSFIEEFFPFFLGLEQAGLDVVAFEGPGQGAVLLRQGVPMTPAWERPTAAVLDALGLEGVTLLGISLGGYLGMRAAAFEPRISRFIAFDVLDDFFECVSSRRGAMLSWFARFALAAGMDSSLDRLFGALMHRDRLADWGVKQGMHVMGVRSPSAFLRETRRYRTESISKRVKQDVLLLAGEDDHFVPGHQLNRQARALTSARSVTTRLFTAREGAAAHCQVGNMPLVRKTMLDWLSRVGSC